MYIYFDTQFQYCRNQMGINGLLQLLKSCCKQKKLHQYRGQRAAVDTYAWLHKIIKGPSGLALIKGGKDKFKFVRDILKRIDKLRSCGVQPVLVFDGGPLPRKRDQEEARKKRREQNYNKAKQLLDAGDEQGYKKMAESVDISPDMAYHLIIELKKNNIEFIVAPYEADAQLAYLCRTGYVDFILTQDSDLLAFGAPKVLYKFDFINFTGQEICLDNIKRMPEVQFNWFTHGMFLTTCILSGCDYLGQLPGIGIRKAQKIISRVTTFKRFIEEMTSQSIPADYEQNFMKAFLTFRFQRVYCPKRKMCVQVNQRNFNQDIENLKQIDQSNTQWSNEVLNAEVLEYIKNHIDQIDFSFLGPYLEKDVARKIAQGIISPITFEAYKLDDLGSLKYNGPGILVETMNITRPNFKKSKDRTEFKQEAMRMANFLSQNNQKRNLLMKPNYRPLKIAQEESIQCYSIDSQSDNQQKSNFILNRSKPSNEAKKDGKESKDRRLMFKNESDEQDEESKSGEVNSSSSSNQKGSKENGLNLDSFVFEKSQSQKAIQISVKDLQFNFTKPIQSVKQPYVQMKPVFHQQIQSPSLNSIEEENQIQQASPVKSFNLNEFLYFEQKEKFYNKIPQFNKSLSHQVQRQLENESSVELKHNAGSTEAEMYDKGERSQETNDNSEQKNPFFELAKSIKPMFGQDFFRNPFRACTQ